MKQGHAKKLTNSNSKTQPDQTGKINILHFIKNFNPDPKSKWGSNKVVLQRQ